MSDERRRPRHSRHDAEDTGKALVVVDMLNPYEHDEADELAENVAQAVPGIRALVEGARDADVPVIYVNDNYGDWNSSAEELADRAMRGRHPDVVEPILPPEGAKFVIKARHSAFYETPLEYLLDQLGASRLVIAGQVTEQCILYSALDAHVRHLAVTVPRDAVAHIHRDLADAALRMMERNMDADLIAAGELSWAE
ncbi:MAG TPA: isochorismatase family cysteine hydrolase [Solirubrobacterales bacterium]|nr:isochorismatase family cysteine hydrolase [Solirubrobacterales bacterium]